MSERFTLNIVSRPTDDAYLSLLRNVAEVSATFGLIIRSHEVRLSERGTNVLTGLAAHLVGQDETQEWPGTKLIGSRMSTRYTYHVCPESLGVLLNATSDLYSWVNPDLPEDLHFLRLDGSTVLGSIAQEDDAWLELDELEMQRVLEGLPIDLNVLSGM